MVEPEQRIMRIPVPVPLIREMDAVIIKGLGGYTTRGEFILDAIQERLLELTIVGTEDAGPPPAHVATHEEVLTKPAAQPAAPTGVTVPMTALVVPPTGFIMAVGDNLAE